MLWVVGSFDLFSVLASVREANLTALAPSHTPTKPISVLHPLLLHLHTVIIIIAQSTMMETKSTAMYHLAAGGKFDEAGLHLSSSPPHIPPLPMT